MHDVLYFLNTFQPRHGACIVMKYQTFDPLSTQRSPYSETLPTVPPLKPQEYTPSLYHMTNKGSIQDH